MKKTSIIILLCLFVTVPLYAQEESIHPLELNKLESYAVDVTVGQRYEWTQLEEGVKLETGHKIEFYFTIDRRIAPILIPEHYVLELSTDMDKAVWQYELRESVQTSKTYVWDTEEEHDWARFHVQLTAFVPKTIDKIKEPEFQKPDMEEDYILDGIMEKSCYVKLAVHKSYTMGVGPGDYDSTVSEITYLATNQRINQLSIEIDKNLSTDLLVRTWSEKYIEGTEKVEAVLSSIEGMGTEIESLSKEGHPGWALNLSKRFKTMVQNLQYLPAPEKFPLFSFLAVAILCAAGGLAAGAFLSRMRKPGPSAESLSSAVNALDRLAREMEQHRKSIATIDDPAMRQTRVKLGRFIEQIERQISNLKYFRAEKYQ
jgi:hypothetical protein